MWCFLAGFASGLYVYKNYDVERIVKDYKPKFMNNENEQHSEDCGVWKQFKNFQKEYRRPSNINTEK